MRIRGSDLLNRTCFWHFKCVLQPSAYDMRRPPQEATKGHVELRVPERGTAWTRVDF